MKYLNDMVKSQLNAMDKQMMANIRKGMNSYKEEIILRVQESLPQPVEAPPDAKGSRASTSPNKNGASTSFADLQS
jgi:hypothetical protein